jgi:hypothetical protein
MAMSPPWKLKVHAFPEPAYDVILAFPLRKKLHSGCVGCHFRRHIFRFSVIQKGFVKELTSVQLTHPTRLSCDFSHGNGNRFANFKGRRIHYFHSSSVFLRDIHLAERKGVRFWNFSSFLDDLEVCVQRFRYVGVN